MTTANGDRERTKTTCPYCGVGCGLAVHTDKGRVVSVTGDPGHPVNSGRTCAKPLALPESVRSRDRALAPLRRESRDARWRGATWDETLPYLADRLGEIRAESGPDAIAFYISGQLLTEDYYAVNKLAKGFLGTNNVDSNSRLCMSSAVAGYEGAFGSDGPPPAFDDVARARCFLLLGTNAAACHPILWARIRNRKEEGATVIVADPRRSETARSADIHLPVRPGTDLALLNAMLWVIDREGIADRGFIERSTEGYEEMMRVAARWPPARAAQVCGVPAADIAAAAQRFAEADGAMALWSMGANQSTVGTLKNRALNNLCLVCGQIGRPGAGPLSLTGQPNAMGGREVGGLAHLLPGYRKVDSATDRAEVERRWGLEPGAISPRPGLVATDLFDAVGDGRVRAVWICATNPAVSLPDSERVREALRRADLVVCQDAYHPTETSALADVVLPAAAWPEKDGTMTNSERRVSLVRRAVDPPGDTLADWEIFARLAGAMGAEDGFGWSSAAEVYDEHAACTAGRLCDVSGISHARLRREGPLQWPCPAADPQLGEHPGTSRLYTDARFPTASGRARLAPTPHAEPDETPDPDFPLILTTGRVAHQWHTMTRTGKSPRLLAAEPEPFVEVSGADAERSGVADGDLARVVTRRGAARMKARVVESMPDGVAFAPFHWGSLHAPAGAGTLNDGTNAATDPTSRQPELKACAARLEPERAATAPPRPVRRGAATGSRRRLVVVGTGMAGLAAVEAALSHRDQDDWLVTMIGREPEAPYNRIMLSRLLASSGRGSVELRPSLWYEARGIDLRRGVDARSIDHAAQEVVLADGDRIGYDALVLATGSRALLPPIPGLERDGVSAFRTLADTRAIAARARDARRAAVIGGGLLGLEAARGLVELGLDVTVVHLVDRLMESQLDGPAARLLARRMRGLGADVELERVTEEVIGNGRAEGLRFAGGDELEADLVVVAAGIKPEVELARESGLEVGRGVFVDDEMRTSAASVWAVGECAEHRGSTYGIWAPLADQARVAGATIAGQPAAFHSTMPATTLKVAGAEVFVAGRPAARGDDEDEIVASDGRNDVYRKLVLRDGHMVGAILVGDLALASRLGELARSDEPVPDDVLSALTASGPAAEPPAEDETMVCTCNAVSRGTILSVARDRDLRSVDDVAEATRATTGCGSCVHDVRGLLSELEAERLDDLRWTRLARQR